ncbi:hypothetical protein D8B34_24505 [Verminephrobacter eiseniae]|nr:hypothetical protein [Verminephrobacter eiseniae]MCW8187536.1 hypothetical protein [Verminephrobacter eiseniae]MCW8225873.1 hypothetical protein [Verminephrobacter eiseniae]MCW8236749.1 hypothetical protein [Verminephrobacter eiseniae]
MAYRVVSRLYFHLPVLFLLFWSLRAEYSTVTLLLAVYSGASTLAADLAPRLGRIMQAMRLVLLGEGMKSLGLALLVIGTMPGAVSLPMLLLGQLVGGTGFALALTADGGLLRVAALGADAETLGRIQGRTQSMMFIATLVSRHRSSVGLRWPSKRIAALHRLPIRSVLAARCALRCAPMAARSLRHLIRDATLVFRFVKSFT